MQQPKNLVIGTAINYGPDQIRNFALSFREFNTHDDVVLLMDNTSIEICQEFLATCNIRPILFETVMYFLKFTPWQIAVNCRLIGYYEFLYQNLNYKHVLISDVKDVLFQRNPFEDLPDEFLYFFTEDTHVTIGQNPFNAEWILQDYGMDTLATLKDLPIICNGNIMGSNVSVQNYLKMLLDEMKLLADNRTQNTMFVDQAVTSYIAHTYSMDKLPRTIKVSGDIVGTIGISLSEAEHDGPRDEIILNMGKIYVNGKIPDLIHQYDRSQFLKDYFNTRYSINKKIN